MQRLAEGLIVPAGPGDAEALAAVHVDSWRETYAGLLPAQYLARMDVARHARRWRAQLLAPGPGAAVLLAERPDGLVGYCAGAPARGDHAEVFTLYVLRRAQGRGLGGDLFRATARVLRAGGASALHLWVLSTNVRAQAYYLHMGGVTGRSRPVSGWGGGLNETCFIWPEIDRLADRR